jgi:mono/diheme cytochrome c family protein
VGGSIVDGKGVELSAEVPSISARLLHGGGLDMRYLSYSLHVLFASLSLSACSGGGPPLPGAVTDDAAVPSTGSDSSPETVRDSGERLDSHASTPVLRDAAVPDAANRDAAVESGARLSFAADIYPNIVESQCAFCHGPLPDGGIGIGEEFGRLDLSSASRGYTDLVGVSAAGDSCKSSSLVRVVPGHASESLLFRKVDGYADPMGLPCGAPMPELAEIPDGGQTSAVERIQQWIDEGAAP